MDVDAIEHLRQTHAAWRLLAADHAAVVLAFCDALFVRPNRRGMPAAELVAALDGFLADLRERHGPDHYPKPARQYLDDWAGPERGFLRKYYPASGAEAAFDLTPATEKALEWVKSLLPPPFVGTESRLLALFDLLRDLSIGGEADPHARIAYTILAAALAYQFGLGEASSGKGRFRFVMIDEAFGRGSDESTRYGLELFGKLDLQLLIVTPLQKIAVIEDYIAAVHFVHNEGGANSAVQNLSIEEYRERRQEFLTSKNLGEKAPSLLA